MTWKEILDEIERLSKREDDIQDATKAYYKVIAPNSYDPYLELGITIAYIKGICRGNKELEDWLAYIAWGVPMMRGSAEVTSADKKEYDFKKQSEQIKFLEEYYPLT